MTKKRPDPKTGHSIENKESFIEETDSEKSIKRGQDAIDARKKVDNRPESIIKKEEKEDAEKWRNEG